MLTLFTFPGDSDQPSFSPFCLKAMCLLNLSNLPWKPRYVGNPSRMPYGRLPVLKTENKLIADSSGIQNYLENQGADFYPGLDASQRALGHALIRMAEENLRCGLVYERWLRDDCWDVVRPLFFAEVPTLMRGVIARMVRKKVRKSMISHGIAQFTEEERFQRLSADIETIEIVFADKPYLLADIPTAADAAIVPIINMLRTLPAETQLRERVRSSERLIAYTNRSREVLYPKAS